MAHSHFDIESFYKTTFGTCKARGKLQLSGNKAKFSMMHDPNNPFFCSKEKFLECHVFFGQNQNLLLQKGKHQMNLKIEHKEDGGFTAKSSNRFVSVGISATKASS